MSRRYDDPREWCETDAELAREVLDTDELAEYRAAAEERKRTAALAKRNRADRLRPQPDPWGGAS